MMSTARKQRPHNQVAEAIRGRIAQGEWSPGSMLPGRKALATEYGVALTTIERAVGTLITEGVLRADDRRGTFVTGSVASEAQSHSPNVLATARIPRIGTLGIIGDLYGPEAAVEHPVRWISDQRIATVLRGVEEVFSQGGGSTRFFNRFNPNSRPTPPWYPIGDCVQEAVAQGVDALTVIGVHEEPGVDVAGEIIAALRAVGKPDLPAILISWGTDFHGLPHIHLDDFNAGYLAARHLIASGYRRLFFLNLYDSQWAIGRRDGVERAVRHADPTLGIVFQALGDATLTLPTRRIMPTSETMTARAIAVLQDALTSGALHPNPEPDAVTAIIVPNDFAAFGAHQVLAEAGIPLGSGCGLIGFDDIPQARELGITSVQPPLERAGSEAAKLALTILRGEETPSEIRLEWRISARISTRLG